MVTVSALTISAMLFVRRTAPAGSYFEDGDRAAGVFGVISTGFAILLGFVVFLAFESYDTSRSGAETEAQVVAQQFQTAQLLPEEAREPLSESPRLLRAERRLRGVAGNAKRHGQGSDQPLERGHVPDAADDRAGEGVRAGGVREVARPAVRSPDRPHRPNPRCRGGDPVPALDRAIHLGRDHLRLHALLRRQQRASSSSRRR